MTSTNTNQPCNQPDLAGTLVGHHRHAIWAVEHEVHLPCPLVYKPVVELGDANGELVGKIPAELSGALVHAPLQLRYRPVDVFDCVVANPLGDRVEEVDESLSVLDVLERIGSRTVRLAWIPVEDLARHVNKVELEIAQQPLPPQQPRPLVKLRPGEIPGEPPRQLRLGPEMRGIGELALDHHLPLALMQIVHGLVVPRPDTPRSNARGRPSFSPAGGAARLSDGDR